MVTIIDGMKAVRSVCLYSSGISYATVKSVFHQNLCGGHRLPELCKSFLALPESGSSRLLLLCFRGSFARLISVSSRQTCDPKSLEYRRRHTYGPGVFPFWQKPLPPSYFPASGAPSCSALEPAATIDFLRDPLAFHWAIPCAFSIFARSFLRLRWGLACPKGDYAWRNMTWQLLAADPAVMSRRFAPANSD